MFDISECLICKSVYEGVRFDTSVFVCGECLAKLVVGRFAHLLKIKPKFVIEVEESL